MAAPVVTIFNATGTNPETVTGIGDMNLSVKYNFLQECENSRLPAMTVAVNLEHMVFLIQRTQSKDALAIHLH